MKIICDWKNCKEIGAYKAPIERDNSRKYRLLCLEHIKIFNKNWNYFENMDDQQIEYFKLNKLVNLNSSDVSYYDCRCQTTVVSKQHETYIRLMPKIKLEDLSKKLISPMPGLIKSIDVSEGPKVKSGDQLLIIEAMKMENILKSEKDCVIDNVLIKPGDSVCADEELILFSK